MNEPHMPRRIGRAGTLARLLLGAATFIGAFLVDSITSGEAVIGLVVAPVVTTLGLRLRGSDAPPLRWTGPLGHVANITIGVAFISLALQPAMLFYGAAMLVAAIRGDAGCEIFTFANTLNGRHDEIGCPVFTPIDLAEGRPIEHGAETPARRAP